MARALRGLLLLLLVGLAPGAPLAHAQGEGPLLVRKAVGPYDLAVAINPAVPEFGVARLTVTVLAASSGEAVADARVRYIVTQAPPREDQPGWAWAFGVPTAPGSYTAGLNLKEPGTWLLSLRVQSDLGEGVLELPLEVPEAARSGGGTLVWGLVVAILAGGFLWLWWTARRARGRHLERRLETPGP